MTGDDVQRAAIPRAPEGSAARRGARAAALALVALVGLAVPASAADAVYVVKPGETLWQIAANLSGSATRWPELYRANRDQIKDPSRLYPGQQLAIPDFSAPAPAPAAPPSASPVSGD